MSTDLRSYSTFMSSEGGWNQVKWKNGEEIYRYGADLFNENLGVT